MIYDFFEMLFRGFSTLCIPPTHFRECYVRLKIPQESAHALHILFYGAHSES